MPGTTICRSWSQRRMMMPLSMTLSTRTPSSVPSSVPRPPEQAGAAENDRGDDGQLEAAAGGGLAGVHQRGKDQPGKAGQEPGDDEDEELQPLGPHAREPRRALVGADRIDVAAERRAPEHDVGGDEHHRGDDDRDRDRADIAGADLGEGAHADAGSAPLRANRGRRRPAGSSWSRSSRSAN